MRVSLTLTLSHLTIRTDDSFFFLFEKCVSGVLAKCPIYGAEATFSFSVGAVCLDRFAEACGILQALRCCRQHQLVCDFSSPSHRLSLFSPDSPLFVFPFTHLKKTVFALLLYYQATKILRTPTSSKQRCGDELARQSVPLLPSANPCPLSFLTFPIHYFLLSE